MQSRVEDILQAMIDGTESSELPKPQSRNEDLLLQVLDKMNEGGGAVIDDTTVSTTKTWSSSKIDSTKLDANQGGANSGKVMGVDAMGDVVPVEVEGGNIAVTETPVSGEDYAIDIVEGEHGSVTSVAGKTGVVTLNGGDVSYSDLVDYGDGTVGGEIADLKSQMDIPTNLVWAYTDNHYIATGNTVTSIDISSPYKESAIYHGKSDFRPCTPGDVFVATLTGAVGYKPYIFVDSVGNVLEKSDNTIIEKRFVAPANAAYVGFNSAGANDYVQIGEDRFDQLDNKYDQRCNTIEQTVEDIQDSLGSVSQLVWAYTDNHYVSTRTSPKNVSAPYSTSASYHGKADFRACLPGDVFIVSLKGDTNYVPFIFCDASGNILVRADNVQYHNERVVAPPSSAYVGFNSVPADTYGTVQIGEYTVDKLQAEIDDVKDDQYNGLSGVAFGTSLTYRAQTTNGYLQYLPQLSGITFDNQGIGSATIMSGILEAIKGYADYSDKRVCILEGFVNDWYGTNPLGVYTDADETTVCGCVRSAINYIYSQNANITVFLVLDHYGKNATLDCSSTAVRGGKTQYEYYSEIAKVAESLGVSVVKLYADSQISENTPQYLSDNIHPTALGAKQTANCIWGKMKQYYPNEIS